MFVISLKDREKKAEVLLDARKRLDKARLKDVMWELITEVCYYPGCQMGYVSVQLDQLTRNIRPPSPALRLNNQ